MTQSYFFVAVSQSSQVILQSNTKIVILVKTQHLLVLSQTDYSALDFFKRVCQETTEAVNYGWKIFLKDSICKLNLPSTAGLLYFPNQF